MNDDIIRMAREAHLELVTKDYPGHTGTLDPWTMHLLDRFAALARADEREACAKVCETEWSNVAERIYGEECAAAIRARGNT